MNEEEQVIHELKILPKFFEAVIGKLKTFEVRYNDRGFKIGHVVILKEYNGQYTGRETKGIITYITDYEQKEGFVVFSMSYFGEGSE